MTSLHAGNRNTSVDATSPIQVTVETSGAEWDDFVARAPGGTADHLWAWRDVLRDVFGHQVAYLSARRAGIIVGVLPLVLFRSRLFGRCAVSLPFLNEGGLLTSDHNAGQALVDEAVSRARAFDATHVELRHRMRQVPSLPYRQHKLGMTLPLPASADALWRSVDRKVRNQVRKAQKEQLESAVGGTELVDEFYAVFSQNMRDLGTPVYAKRLFEVVLRQFPDRARITVIRHHGQPVAAAMTLSFRDVVVNPWASSLRAFRHLCPNMLLYWIMLERAVQDGARTFDFGRSTPGGGTHQFKLQWGAVETPLHWEYILLSRNEPPNQGPSNPRFGLAIRLWQRLPIGLANIIGPRVARHLP